MHLLVFDDIRIDDIKQLLDEVFVICGIINVEVRVICRLRDSRIYILAYNWPIATHKTTAMYNNVLYVRCILEKNSTDKNKLARFFSRIYRERHSNDLLCINSLHGLTIVITFTIRFPNKFKLMSDFLQRT